MFEAGVMTPGQPNPLGSNTCPTSHRVVSADKFTPKVGYILPPLNDTVEQAISRPAFDVTYPSYIAGFLLPSAHFPPILQVHLICLRAIYQR